MRKHILLLHTFFLLGLVACRTQNLENPQKQSSPIQFSKTYEPPVFEEKERIQSISAALKASHGFYTEAAAVHNLPGLAYGVVVDDSLVFFGASGKSNLELDTEVTEHSLFRIASMSKSFTAMAILKLRDEGKLCLEEPASTYIPELEKLKYLSDDAPQVSIFNLLTMTAGFPEDNPWGDRFLDISDKALMEQVAEGISFSTVPSLHYEYSNLGFGLLGHIITQVSGVPYQEYITNNILHPLGMMNTCWEFSEVSPDLLVQGYRWEDEKWKVEPLLHDGAFGAMGGLITSITDFSKYISYHLSAWPPRSGPDSGPVKRSTLREMHRMNNPRYYNDPQRFGDHSSPIMRGYGFGLVAMEDHKGVREIGHNGGLPGFGSSYMFYPEYGMGIMAFSNLTYVGGTVREANYMVMKELIKQGVFLPRRLPVSDILERRKKELVELISGWDPELEKEIVAANLYMDISRETRMKEAKKLLEQIGKIVATGPVNPENQLRGSFLVIGKHGKIEVYFTLSPEVEPRIQWLTLELIQGK
jgi:CubicO group peptidase (beta-lactamase class C family)